MASARGVGRHPESRIGEKYWPYPTYGDLLFGV